MQTSTCSGGRSGTKTKEPVRQSCEGGSRENKKKSILRGVMFDGLRRIPTIPALDPHPYSYFNCWRTGYFAARCPSPQTVDHCPNCGQRFVTLKDCPRCAENHREFMKENEQGAKLREKNHVAQSQYEECKQSEVVASETESKVPNEELQESEAAAEEVVPTTAFNDQILMMALFGFV